MGSSKRNLLTSILLLVVMGVFAVLTIFIVVDAINKKYYNDIKVEYEVQEESPNIILTFARNEGSKFSTDNTKVMLNEDKTKFRIDGTVPTIEKGIVTNLDDLTSSDGREFYFFSTNSSFIDPQEDPENPDFIFSETDFRYYVSTEDNPIWYDVPKSSENLTLYSVFLTPNIHNSDFANAPLLNTSPNVIISHDVVDIPYNAFNKGDLSMGAKIESVVIPNSTKSINSEIDIVAQTMGGAFALCTTLTNIVIPSSVEYVGGEAFMVCTGLDTVKYGNGFYLPTENNEHAILIDTNLKVDNVTIHEACISIQGNTFSKYASIMMGLLIPPLEPGEEESVEDIIGDYANINLQEISIPKNVKNIGFGAFAMCMGLENVVFEDNSDLINIGMGSFNSCSSLKTINLEDTKLEEIGAVAFATMNDSMPAPAIEEITLPSTLKTIGVYAFEDCSSLRTVNFEDNSQITSIGEGAFTGCSSLTSIIIPDSVTSIGGYAFGGCTGLTNITFEDMTGLTSIGGRIFDGCDNVKELIIQSGEVKDLDFYYLSNLTTVTLGDGVTSIGDSAFESCSSLETVTFRDNSQLTSIGESAFEICSSLTSITIPSGVTSIGKYAFSCSSLTSISIPSGVTSIGNSAFSGCSSLTSITIPDSVTSIGRLVFYGCDSLTSITIPESVTSIGERAFHKCSSLETVTFEGESQLTSIGDYAFEDCSSLTSISIPDSVTSIGNDAFYNCSSLTSITIPDSVTSIGDYAFYDCTSLTSITIPESVTSIGKHVFSGCSKLTIYCEASSRPSGWDSRWNSSNRPEYWDGEWKMVDGVPVPKE